MAPKGQNSSLLPNKMVIEDNYTNLIARESFLSSDKPSNFLYSKLKPIRTREIQSK